MSDDVIRTLSYGFDWCADRLDATTPEELHALRDDGFDALRSRLRTRWQELTDPMPEILGPAVTAFYDHDGDVMLEGYSHYAPSIWPRGIWMLFSPASCCLRRSP